MKRIHYSWVILFVAFFSILVAGIVRSASGVFIVPLETDFGWERSTISFAFALSLFLYGISGPFMAALIEVTGLKKMMVAAMATLLIGVSLTLVMSKPWQLILIWGVIIGLGSSLFLTVLISHIVNQWFGKRRGLALLLLPFALSKGSIVLLVLFSIFYGLDWIATVPPTVNISRQIFGMEKSVVVYGWIFAAHQLGSAVAASGAGWMYQTFNSYSWAFTLAGLLCLLASLFVLVIKKQEGEESTYQIISNP
ncbi:MAG: MFS transporter [Anoxybacillus gonensis]|nr:MFS transporter [Anoxybacillus gonensis]